MRKKPAGVMPYWMWRKSHPDPTLRQLLARYKAVSECVHRWRESRKTPHPPWLAELFGDVGRIPCRI